MDTLNHLKGKRCFITGGKGFVGKSLAKKLISLGAEVIAPTRAEMDLTKSVEVAKKIHEAQPEILFHLAAAGVVHGPGPSEINNVNVLGTHTLVSTVKQLTKTPVLILMGSCSEYKDKKSSLLETDELGSLNDYGLSKIKAAELARKDGQGLSIRWVRLFNCYGPYEPAGRLLPYMVNEARSGLPIEVTAGEQYRDFTYIDDVSEALIRLALSAEGTKNWEDFNLGSGRPVYLKEYIDLIKKTLAEFNIHANIRYGAKPYRTGEAMNIIPDISKLRKNLNWAPPTSIKDGVRNTIQFMLSA